MSVQHKSPVSAFCIAIYGVLTLSVCCAKRGTPAGGIPSTLDELRMRGIEVAVDDAEPADLDTIGVDLQKAIEMNGTSYHRMLRDCTHAVRKRRYERRAWGPVEASLQRQGFSLISQEGDLQIDIRKYLTVKDAFRTASGLGHDLYLKFWIDGPDTEEVTSGRPSRVIGVRVGMLAQIGAPYKAVVEGEEYGPGTAVYVVLRQEKVRAIAKELPILQSVDVYYDLIPNHHMEYWWSGFYVVLKLEDTTMRGMASAWVSYVVESGLDPPWFPEVNGFVKGLEIIRSDLPRGDTLGRVINWSVGTSVMDPTSSRSTWGIPAALDDSKKR